MRILKNILTGTTFLALTACGSGDEQSGVNWTGEAPEASASLSVKSNYLKSRGNDPAAQFEYGIVEAMQAIETIYQYRYKHYSGELPLTPGGMAGNLPNNPDAKFDPAFIENAMKDALVHLAIAEASLSKASGNDFAVVLDANDFWFDIDENGERSELESLTNYLPAIFGEPRGMRSRSNAELSPVHFDTADADWALAYVHTLSGMAEMVLAMDPTPAIKTVVKGRDALFDHEGANAADMMGFDSELDTIAAVLLIMRGRPDADRTRKAHKHFLAMIDANRDFWRRVELETDNDREWLPNANQTSSFGIEVNAEMADQWQEVLSEIEDILNGDKLVPYWRVDSRQSVNPGLGLNMKKIF